MLSRHLLFFVALASLLCNTVKTQGCFRTEHTGCRKRCNSNSDCRGRNKQCLCDGACGKSCVNPRLVCPNLEPPPNGQLGYMHATRRFNSHAFVACDQGYELQGTNTRRCRGNGQWSGETPDCDVRVFRCSAPDPPQNGRIRLVSWSGSFVPDGEHQRTSYTDGETFGYECNPGFHLQGVTRRTCSLANHGWDTLEPTACLNYTACGAAGISQAQEPRIVGGTISPEGKWRWQAALYGLYSGPPLDSLAEKLTSDRYRIKCGGSLIDNSWVLTAAHCLDDGPDSLKRYFVKLGIADRGNEGNMLDQRQASDVDWIYMYRENNIATMVNDIALVHLSTPVTIGRYVGTVCLPDVAGLNVSLADMYSGRGTVTGWGHTRVRQPGSYAGMSRQLREVQLPIQSREVCSRNRGGSFQPNTFCAGAGVRENGTMRDSCKGDSGGPLSRLINEPGEEGRWIQLGIVSTGTGCGLLNEYGVYVNVSSYTNWIRGATVLYERQQDSNVENYRLLERRGKETAQAVTETYVRDEATQGFSASATTQEMETNNIPRSESTAATSKFFPFSGVFSTRSGPDESSSVDPTKDGRVNGTTGSHAKDDWVTSGPNTSAQPEMSSHPTVKLAEEKTAASWPEIASDATAKLAQELTTGSTRSETSSDASVKLAEDVIASVQLRIASSANLSQAEETTASPEWTTENVNFSLPTSTDNLQLDDFPEVDTTWIWPLFELPKHITPYHYTVQFRPFVYDKLPGNMGDSVEGSLEMFLYCNVSTDMIIFHTQKISMKGMKLRNLNVDGDEEAPEIVGYALDIVENMYLLNLSKPLKSRSSYVLSVDYFLASIPRTTGSGVGFINFQYTDTINGTSIPRTLLTTHFETSHARKAFPCFDEPVWKATFNISIVHKAGMVALSNMPVWYQEQGADGWVTTYFEQTPRMSTYLVEIVLADHLPYRENSWRNVKLRVYARESQVDRTDYVLNILPHMLDWMENYTGIPYGLPKLDFIAIPTHEGKSASAMEHWGIIVANDHQLLYHPNHSSVWDKNWVKKIAAHELVHQWYGNIVTCQWWDDIFINEGITSFLDTNLQETLDPALSQQTLMHFEVENSMVWISDSTPNPPTLVPSFDGLIFSSQVYYKSIYILHFMERLIGKTNLQRVFKELLYKHMYEMASVEDLFSEVASINQSYSETGDNITPSYALERWMRLEGYPLITVSVDNYTRQITLSQHQFFETLIRRLGDDLSEPSTTVWPVPISYISETDPVWDDRQDFLWLNTTKESFNVTAPKDGWFVLNPERVGFYRVIYDSEIYDRLAHQLKTNHQVFDPITRSAIIDDALAACSTGYLGNETIPKLLEYFATKEKHVLPWLTLLLRLYRNQFPDLFDFSSSESKEYVRDLLDDTYLTVGWESSETEPSTTRYLRMIILTAACFWEHPNCTEEAIRRYLLWTEDPDNYWVHPDIRPAVFCTAYHLREEMQPEKSVTNFADRLTDIFVMPAAYGVPFQCYLR